MSLKKICKRNFFELELIYYYMYEVFIIDGILEIIFYEKQTVEAVKEKLSFLLREN